MRIKGRYVSLVFVVLLGSIFSGCSSPSYNPDDPSEYVEYWCDPANRHNAIPPDKEWRSKIQHDTDESYRQSCIDDFKNEGKK